MIWHFHLMGDTLPVHSAIKFKYLPLKISSGHTPTIHPATTIGLWSLGSDGILILNHCSWLLVIYRELSQFLTILSIKLSALQRWAKEAVIFVWAKMANSSTQLTASRSGFINWKDCNWNIGFQHNSIWSVSRLLGRLYYSGAKEPTCCQ